MKQKPVNPILAFFAHLGEKLSGKHVLSRTELEELTKSGTRISCFGGLYGNSVVLSGRVASLDLNHPGANYCLTTTNGGTKPVTYSPVIPAKEVPARVYAGSHCRLARVDSKPPRYEILVTQKRGNPEPYSIG